ncbi:nidogen-like isoform X2 [Ischnura elegans]|uniref:nidogen-like isoform X2 n=1 Tax=Ischnura elegans TaxID=197161 RepID=UPI001ED89C6C|nr:nidogen-like isoform X2 [Ischnura elegans]
MGPIGGAFVFLFLLAAASAVRLDELWPHGSDADQYLPPDQDEVSSFEIPLKVPVTFYDDSYSSIYVNSNGLLSFRTEIPSFFNIQFPLDYPVIAPFYSDVDTRGAGTIFYRETQDEALLSRATGLVREYFSSASSFEAKSVFIATWKGVGYYNKGADKVNTFQVVLMSDGESSFAALLYPEDGVQWVQGTGKSTSLPDARGQAGFVSGDGRVHALRGSGTHQIRNVDKWSNTGLSGLWVYHIGNTGPSGNVGEPDMGNTVSPPLEREAESCAAGGTVCHIKATCIDYDPGFCCHCQNGYYGNGINCLKEDIPLRVNGKVSGTINGISVSDMDLQAYVVTSDGRTYTAISRVPDNVGFDIQVLNVIGGVIGWMFAKPLKGAVNGFQLTGGTFNYTAEIEFPNSGQHVSIHNYYYGFDVFDQLRMEVHIFGDIPSVPRNTKIEIMDYDETFTYTAAGVVQAYSLRKYQLEGVKIDNPFTTRHVITYNECKYMPANLTTQLVKVARNFIVYDARERIIRYAMTNKVSPPGDINPCKDGAEKCGAHSACIVEGDSFRCVCNPGYRQLYSGSDSSEGFVCVDENECTTGTHKCDKNAICYNEDGGYRCLCNHGYEGDGKYCQRMRTCSDIQCHPNAECILPRPGQPECRCFPGFKGNGYQCTAVTQEVSCDIENNCSPFAVCTYSEEMGESLCVCLPGYVGDGLVCHDASSYNASQGPPLPTCISGSCWCPQGYDYDGQGLCTERSSDYDNQGEIESHESYPEAACIGNICICPKGYVLAKDSRERCMPKAGASLSTHGTKGISGFKITCNVVNNCHPHAQCIYVTPSGHYQCQCNAGYEGDGYECSETDECRVSSDCGSNAQCLFNNELQRHECICSLGFSGDGKSCHPNEDSAECATEADCHRDASCAYDVVRLSFVCRCNQGFSGDGKQCSPAVIGCNIVNNCGPNADCLFDINESGYKCRCKEGFEGDGFTCQKDASCQHDATVCHEKAACVPTRGTYYCQCNDGYTGNGLHCKAVLKHEGNFLLVNQGMATLRLPFNPSPAKPGRPIQIQNFQMAIGIDVDCQEGRVYWSDIIGKTIKSSKYDGSDIQTFLDIDIGTPEGLSIDWVSRNIYWTDSNKGTIEVANLDSKIRTVLVEDGLVNPRGIAVHPSKGKLFWTDWNRESPKIEWANLDGSQREIFLHGSVELPNYVALDYELDELCWTDAGTKRIECMGLHSSIRRTVASNCSYPFGLTISSANYYWTDWTTQKVESAKRPNGEPNKPLVVPLGGSGNLYDVVAVPQECTRLYNLCQYNTSPCPDGHLCMPNGRGGRSCVCGLKYGEVTPSCNDVVQ